jgi:hypothetical protein
MAKRRKPSPEPMWGEDDIVPPHIVRAIHPFDVGLQRFARAAYEAKRKPRKPSPRGAPPKYDHAAIKAVAEEVAEDGAPDRQSWFYEKVRDLLHERHVKAPEKTQLMEIIKPIYERARAAKPHDR